MANYADDRAEKLRLRLEKLDELIDKLTDRLVDVTDAHVIDTGADSARHAGSQRLKLLQEERKEILKQIAEIPFDGVYPVAIGYDVLGSDIGEAVLS
jgi:hypothetical protein